jgi:hypothetical protein
MKAENQCFPIIVDSHPMQLGLAMVMSLPLILIRAQVGDSRASGLPAHIDALAAKVHFVGLADTFAARSPAII